MEIWKDVIGYEGLYQVSNLGRVKSLSRIDARGHKRKEKILSSKPNSRGYLMVYLFKNGKRKPFFVHRLVAIAFIPNPDNLPEVNHKDEDKLNNHVNNLEWCTSKYNINYGTRSKRVSKKISKKVRCITTGEIFGSIREAGEKYNIKQSHICECCKGKLKSAGKHPVTKEKLVWEYI